MIVLLLLVPLSIGIAVAFLAAFIWAVRSGQYEDIHTPSMRALMEEPSAMKPRAQTPGTSVNSISKAVHPVRQQHPGTESKS